MDSKNDLRWIIDKQYALIEFLLKELRPYWELNHKPEELKELIKAKEQNRTISPAQQVMSEDNSRFVCEKW